MTLEKGKLIYQELSGLVIGAFYAVYNALGFGFLESVYASAMALELSRRGLSVEREVPTQVYFLGQPIATFRLDMLVEKRLVVEIKASKKRSQMPNASNCSTICDRRTSNSGYFCTSDLNRSTFASYQQKSSTDL